MQKAIGIFDSGIGGLTVLKEIVAALPDENIIYLGDTARVPYGIRSAETVTRYSFENTQFLLAQDIKMLVVACNTASAISLEAVKKEFPLPVIGVLEPGARAAVRETRAGRIGVIGTEATIASGAYEKAITLLDAGITVHSLACPLFVPLVEEGWIDNDVALLVARTYLEPLQGRRHRHAGAWLHALPAAQRRDQPGARPGHHPYRFSDRDCQGSGGGAREAQMEKACQGTHGTEIFCD